MRPKKASTPDNAAICRLAARSDLGGYATCLPGVEKLGSFAIDRPIVILAGGNGCGKSSTLAMLRIATGLEGQGIGRTRRFESLESPLPPPQKPLFKKEKPQADLGRLALQTLPFEHRNSYSPEEHAQTPEGSPGVLDIQALGWKGQRTFLHDSRWIDGEGMRDVSEGDMIGPLRRARERESQSHGQALDARLRYAIAWGLGLFDLRDPYDIPQTEDNKDQRWSLTSRDVWAKSAAHLFQACSGHPQGEGSRHTERWLLLDEPEVGLSPPTLAKNMAVLLEHAEFGNLRIFCATQSTLLIEGLRDHPKVQIIDLDGWSEGYHQALQSLGSSTLARQVAEREKASLNQAIATATSEDNKSAAKNGQNWSLHRRCSLPRN